MVPCRAVSRSEDFSTETLRDSQQFSMTSYPLVIKHDVRQPDVFRRDVKRVHPAIVLWVPLQFIVIPFLQQTQSGCDTLKPTPNQQCSNKQPQTKTSVVKRSGHQDFEAHHRRGKSDTHSPHTLQISSTSLYNTLLEQNLKNRLNGFHCLSQLVETQHNQVLSKIIEINMRFGKLEPLTTTDNLAEYLKVVRTSTPPPNSRQKF